MENDPRSLLLDPDADLVRVRLAGAFQCRGRSLRHCRQQSAVVRPVPAARLAGIRTTVASVKSVAALEKTCDLSFARVAFLMHGFL